MQHISYVLQDEYDHLLKQKNDLEDKYKQQSLRKREACQQGAETRHDNADYEDAEYQQYILSRRLDDINKIIYNTKVVLLQNLQDGKIRIGSTVHMDIDTQEHSYTIGGCPTLPGRISYQSPLGKLLIDKKVGDVCQFHHEKKTKTIHILSVINHH